jgi:hypothetical protein
LPANGLGEVLHDNAAQSAVAGRSPWTRDETEVPPGRCSTRHSAKQVLSQLSYAPVRI